MDLSSEPHLARSPAKAMLTLQKDVQHGSDQDAIRDTVNRTVVEPAGRDADSAAGTAAAEAGQDQINLLSQETARAEDAVPRRACTEWVEAAKAGDHLEPQQKQLLSQETARAEDAVPRCACTEWVEAAKAGDHLELRRLLRAWPSILNRQVGGLQCTAAHWAAANGHADALQHLLQCGADVMVQTATGCLPLHSAAAAGRAECVQQLLLADPALQQHQLTALNEDGLTAAALALRHGHKMVQGMLLQAAAAAASHAAERVGDSPPVPHQDLLAAHPSHQGMQQQQEHSRRPGMKRGFLLGSTTTSSGSSPTAQANNSPGRSGSDADTDPGYGAKQATDLPAGAGASGAVDAAAATAAARHETCSWSSTVDNPLYGVACSPIKQPRMQQNTQTAGSCLARTPIDAMAAAPEVAADSLTALPPDSKAVSTAESEQQQQQQGQEQETDRTGTAAAAGSSAGPAVERGLGRSWLDAARAGDLHCMQQLLLQDPRLLNYRGAGISYAFVGNSALHWAAAKGHVAVVCWLLQQGAAVPAGNEAGSTALHTAVEHGQPACAELLVLMGGADVQAADGYGQSAVSIAAAAGGSAGRRTDNSSSSSRGSSGVLAEQLLLWDQARKLQQQDR